MDQFHRELELAKHRLERQQDALQDSESFLELAEEAGMEYSVRAASAKIKRQRDQLAETRQLVSELEKAIRAQAG